MHPRPFRFGTIVLTADSKQAWKAKAQKTEDLGYAILQIPDHIGSLYEAVNQFAPVPALVAAADATSSLRLGSFVRCSRRPIFPDWNHRRNHRSCPKAS